MHARCEYIGVLSTWKAFNACYGEGNGLKHHLPLPRLSAVGGTRGRVKVCLFGGEMRMGFMPNLLGPTPSLLIPLFFSHIDEQTHSISDLEVMDAWSGIQELLLLKRVASP